MEKRIMHDNPKAGTIFVEYPTPLIAGEFVTVKFTYRIGPAGMAEGSRLRIGLPNPGWGKPLVPQAYFWDCYQKGKDRRYTDYDRVNTTAEIVSDTRKAAAYLTTWPGFRKPFQLPRKWLKDYDRWWIEAILEDDGLDPEDEIILTYGDPNHKPSSAYIQRFADRKLCFLAYADPENTNEFTEAAGSPCMISIQAGPASQLDVFIPSVCIPGDTPKALVAYTDSVKLKPSPAPQVSSLKISASGGCEYECRVDKAVSSPRIDMPVSEIPDQNNDSIHIGVTDCQRDWQAVSNPMIVRESGPRLFWGDLHCQSMYHGWSEADQIGISCGTPEELYDYAYNVAGLDFCAITDGDTICIEGTWPVVRDAALQANRDGEFVVFQGTEIGDNIDGHRNTIFATGKPEPSVYRDFSDGVLEDHDGVLEAHKAQKLFHDRDDVLMIYHHTKMWNNWSNWDPSIESVLEIYSGWGSGEKRGTDRWEVLAEMSGGAQEAWAKGYRLGVIAGSDSHVGTPGRNLANCERDEMLIYPNGIAAIWAPELTRKAIFEALKNRHCYGTTGVRIILEFFLEQHPMGSEVAWPDKGQARPYRINVWGTDGLSSITVVKNNKDVKMFRPESDQAQLEWQDSEGATSGDYTYIRVTQNDGHMAWSSPIWLV